jgi:purine-nucleoside phosphorylase
MSLLFTTIFVPKGAEFQAIQRGVQKYADSGISVIPIPMGPQAVHRFFRNWLSETALKEPLPSAIMIMGLCGSLSPTLKVGDGVLYQTCLDAKSLVSVPEWFCDRPLLMSLQERLKKSVTLVTAITCDRMVHRVADKQSLSEQSGAQVVDMEGAAIFRALKDTGIQIATIRVVSDDLQHELPDLSQAITVKGDLNPMALAQALLRDPLKGWNLVRGSTQGLRKLEAIAADLATERSN